MGIAKKCLALLFLALPPVLSVRHQDRGGERQWGEMAPNAKHHEVGGWVPGALVKANGRSETFMRSPASAYVCTHPAGSQPMVMELTSCR